MTEGFDPSEISVHHYIWGYTTDFAKYVQSHPNWFVLGQNLRFFHYHGARGVFEQGAHQSNGAEMSELRATVSAPMRHLSEGGLTPQAFVSEFAVDERDP